ncbi:MAG: glycoside hydrolase 100 family protein [Nanoarchaeota archaeon]
MNQIEEAYEQAIKVLEKCATNHGFHAAHPGYQGIWARDSNITSLGASLLGDKFKEEFKSSLIMLAKGQSEKGQIPNAVLCHEKPIKIDYKSIDSTLWFLIGHYIFKQRYNDSSLINKYKKNIEKALTWLSYQDMGEDSMLEQLPTTDWQDAFPHRYGHTINTQALYYKVLQSTNQKEKARKLKEQTNNNEDNKLWNGSFYLPWRWKNHRKYQEKGEWFDSLGNLLSIIFELADDQKSNKILEYIKKNNISKPYPVKAIYPPITKDSKDWQPYFEDCGAKTPYNYLNAGIWTFIGGFYILALIKQGNFKEAEHQLEKLAEANLQSGFAEWLHGQTGKIGTSSSKEGNQAWNAGMYILAYQSIKEKKCLI